MDKLTEQLEKTRESHQFYGTISQRKDKSNDIIKIKFRKVLIGQQVKIQFEKMTEKQVFHENFNMDDSIKWIVERMAEDFSQLELHTDTRRIHCLVSQKGKVTIKVSDETIKSSQPLNHNRDKQYIIKEGSPVAFLVDLGVMSESGNVIRGKYDKFKQINRFLEMIRDIEDQLSKEKTNRIIDFGCGKSYLTFAMYYYLHELKGYPVEMIGLDLKTDVIEHCNSVAKRYGYDHVRFQVGDISGYDEFDQVDMVVTLHACDTATDFALFKAVAWKAKVILSVPCCQHELNGMIQNDLLSPVFEYGVLKERMAALMTDGLRGHLLKVCGYQVSLLEFIDTVHTPKNLMIRGIKVPGDEMRLDLVPSYHQIKEAFKADLTFERLLIEAKMI